MRHRAFPLIGLVGLAACECDLTAPSDACHALNPAERGPFEVGVTTLLFEDPDRSSSFGDTRPLKIEVWYPAAASAASLPRDAYQFAREAPADLQGELNNVVLEHAGQDAARDALPYRRYAPYPLLTFSHGKNGIRFQTPDLMVHLASHGYVVAAPDHTDDLVWELLRTGELDVFGTVGLLVDRPKDLSFVADQLAALDDPRWRNLVDVQRWGVFGHSFGGTTAIAISARTGEFYDSRVKAQMPITPAVRIVEALAAGPTGSDVPMLMMAGKQDSTIDYDIDQQWGYEIGEMPKVLVGVERAGHFSFTVLCKFDLPTLGMLYGIDVSSVVNDGCGPNYIQPPAMNAVLNWYATAFFNRFLRDSPDSAAFLQPGRVPAEIAAEVQHEISGI